MNLNCRKYLDTIVLFQLLTIMMIQRMKKIMIKSVFVSFDVEVFFYIFSLYTQNLSILYFDDASSVCMVSKFNFSYIYEL